MATRASLDRVIPLLCHCKLTMLRPIKSYGDVTQAIYYPSSRLEQASMTDQADEVFQEQQANGHHLAPPQSAFTR